MEFAAPHPSPPPFPDLDAADLDDDAAFAPDYGPLPEQHAPGSGVAFTPAATSRPGASSAVYGTGSPPSAGTSRATSPSRTPRKSRLTTMRDTFRRAVSSRRGAGRDKTEELIRNVLAAAKKVKKEVEVVYPISMNGPHPAVKKRADGDGAHAAPSAAIAAPRKVLMVLVDTTGKNRVDMSTTMDGARASGWQIKYVKCPAVPTEKLMRTVGFEAGAVLFNIPDRRYDPQYLLLLSQLRQRGLLVMQVPHMGGVRPHDYHLDIFDCPQKVLKPVRSEMDQWVMTHEDGYRELVVLLTGGADSASEREAVRSRVAPALAERCRKRGVRLVVVDQRELNPGATAPEVAAAMEEARHEDFGVIHVHVVSQTCEFMEDSNMRLRLWFDTIPEEERTPWVWLRSAHDDLTRAELELYQALDLWMDADDVKVKRKTKDDKTLDAGFLAPEEKPDDPEEEKKREPAWERHKHTLVFSRKRAFYESLPARAKDFFWTDDPVHRERLAALHALLYAHPQVQVKFYDAEYYSAVEGSRPAHYVRGLDGFAAAVEEDLWERIKLEFPPRPEHRVCELEQEPEWRLKTERRYHYIRPQYEKTLVQRIKLGKPKVIVVLGREGGGLTTLMARCAREARRAFFNDTGDDRDEIVTISYFVGVSDPSNSLVTVLQHLCRAIAKKCRLECRVPSAYNDLRFLLPKLMQAAVKHSKLASRRLAIFIDGVSDLHNPMGLHWLPLEKEVPDGVQLVVSASYIGSLGSDKLYKDDHELARTSRRARLCLDALSATYPEAFAAAMKVVPMQHHERKGFLNKRMRASFYEIEQPLMLTLLGKGDMTRMQYSAAVANIMNHLGSPAVRRAADDFPHHLDEMLLYTLELAERTYGPRLIRALLSTMELAQDGLTWFALQHFVAEHVEEVDREHWLRHRCPQCLRLLVLFVRGPVQGKYCIAHEGASRIIARRYLADREERIETYGALADFFGQFVGPAKGISFVASKHVLGQAARFHWDTAPGFRHEEALLVFRHALSGLLHYYCGAELWDLVFQMLTSIGYIQAKVTFELLEQLVDEYDVLLLPAHSSLEPEAIKAHGKDVDLAYERGTHPYPPSAVCDKFHAWAAAQGAEECGDILSALSEMRMFVVMRRSALSLRPAATLQLAANFPDVLFPAEQAFPYLGPAEAAEEYLVETPSRYVLRWLNKPEEFDRCFMAMPHPEEVTSITVTDFGHVVTCCKDANAYVWDAYTGALVLVIHGHTHPVRACAAFGNKKVGYCLVTASDDGAVKVWSLNRGGQLTATLNEHEDKVTAVAFAHSGEYFVSGGTDRTVRIWDAVELKELYCLDLVHTDLVLHVACSADNLIASCGWDGKIQLHYYVKGADPEPMAPLTGHLGCVVQCCFSPDGKLLASASHDKTAVVWNPTGGVVAILRGHRSALTSCAFSPSARLLATASTDCTIRLWEIETSRCISLLHGHDTFITHVNFTRQGDYVLSVSDDRTLRFWGRIGAAVAPEAAHGGASPTHKLSQSSWDALAADGAEGAADHDTQAGHAPAKITCLCRAAGGESFLTASEDNTLVLWGARTGEGQITFQGHEKPVRKCAAATEQGAYRILSAGDDGNVLLWNISTGLDEAVMQGHAGAVYCCDWNRSCALAASAGKDKAVNVWDMSSSETGVVSSVARLEGHAERVFDLSFSPVEEAMLVTGSRDGTVRLWDAEARQTVAQWGESASEVRTSKFSLDGASVCFGGSDERFQLLDKRSGQVTLDLDAEGVVRDASFSSTWSWWVAYAAGPAAVIVDLRQHREVARFECDDGKCVGVAFGQDAVAVADSLGRLYVLGVEKAPFKY